MPQFKKKTRRREWRSSKEKKIDRLMESMIWMNGGEFIRIHARMHEIYIAVIIRRFVTLNID